MATITCREGSRHRTMTSVLLCDAGNPIELCLPGFIREQGKTVDEKRLVMIKANLRFASLEALRGLR